MKRKTRYGIIGGVIFLVIGLFLGMTTGMNIGGNYYPEFKFLGGRG